MSKELREFIGVKTIMAIEAQQHTCTKEDCNEGIDGYKVIYPQPDGSAYESWSPKDVFEKAYTETEIDKKKTRELICTIVEEINNEEGLFLPQSYLWKLLDKLEKNGVTYAK